MIKTAVRENKNLPSAQEEAGKFPHYSNRGQRSHQGKDNLCMGIRRPL